MSHIPDRRPAIRQGALASTELAWREKAYIVCVTELSAENDPGTGRRRVGSRAMNHKGEFALHRDYIASHLGTTVEVVKKIQQTLLGRHVLSLVYPGRYSRPAGYQALVLSGDTTSPLKGVHKGGHHVPAKGIEPDPISGDTTSPLTYRGGTDPARQGLPRPSPSAGGQAAPRSERREIPAHLPIACTWHVGDECPNCESRSA